MSEKVLGFVPGGTGRLKPFDALYTKGVMIDRNLEDIAKLDALVIWGGSDISPSLYGELPGKHMYYGKDPSNHDLVEWNAVQEAHKQGVPVIGVCRGAQMLCAAAGGRLWQHTGIHGRDHDIVTNDGQRMETSSVHHQMMRPEGTEHEVLAYDPRKQTVFDSHDQEHVLETSPEVVYFNNWGLAIQGHPEFMARDSEFVQYCLGLIKEKVL